MKGGTKPPKTKQTQKPTHSKLDSLTPPFSRSYERWTRHAHSFVICLQTDPYPAPHSYKY